MKFTSLILFMTVKLLWNTLCSRDKGNEFTQTCTKPDCSLVKYSCFSLNTWISPGHSEVEYSQRYEGDSDVERDADGTVFLKHLPELLRLTGLPVWPLTFSAGHRRHMILLTDLKKKYFIDLTAENDSKRCSSCIQIFKVKAAKRPWWEGLHTSPQPIRTQKLSSDSFTSQWLKFCWERREWGFRNKHQMECKI